jgi:hypothetical protein
VGSGYSNATSVLRPRGATVWPASSSALAKVSARSAARSIDASRSAATRTSSAANENAIASRESAASNRRPPARRTDSRPREASSKEPYVGAIVRTRSPNSGSTNSIPVPSAPHSHFWPAAA